MLITNFAMFYPRTHALIRGPCRKFPPLRRQQNGCITSWLWPQSKVSDDCENSVITDGMFGIFNRITSRKTARINYDNATTFTYL